MVQARATYEIAAIDRTRAALDSVNRNLAGVQKAFASIGPAAVAAFGAAGIAGLIKATIFDTAKSLDELNDSAAKLGLLPQELDRLRFAAELSGLEAEGLAKSIKIASRNLVEAEKGTGATADALRALGISARDSSGHFKSAEGILLEVADRLPRLGSEAEKTAVLLDIFGKSGTDLRPLLNEGSQGIRDMLVEADVLGTRFADLAGKGDEFQDAQSKLNRALRATRDAIAVAVIPSLGRLAEFLATKLVNTVTGTTEQWRRFVAELGLEAPATALEKITAETAKLEAELAGLQKSFAQTQSSVAGRLKEAFDIKGSVESQRRILELIRELDNLNSKREEVLAQQRRASEEEQAFAAAEERARQAPEEERLKRQRELIALIQQTTLAEKLSAVELSRIGEDTTVLVAQRVNFVGLQLRESVSGIETASAAVGDRLTDSLGGAFAQLITDSENAADAFRDAWKNAIADVAESLGTSLFKGVLGSVFPFLGGALGFETATAGASFQQQSQQVAPQLIVNNSFQSLLPASTGDFVRAAQVVQESRLRLQRFQVAG